MDFSSGSSGKQAANKFIWILMNLFDANIHILLNAEFSAMDYTLNIVSKCRFFIFKHLQAPKTSSKIFRGGPGISWIFLSVKVWDLFDHFRNASQ